MENNFFNPMSADEIKDVLESTNPDWLKAFINMDSFTGLSSAVGNIAEGLKPLAGAICCLFMLISLVELAANDKFTLDQFMMFFVKVALSLALIEATPSLIELGNAVSVEASAAVDKFDVSNIASGSSETIDPAAEISEALKPADGSVLTGLQCAVQRLAFGAGKIATFFASLLVGTVLISRLFELALRGAFMPLAMGFIADEGVKGAAMRYLKQYLAVWLQGPAISVCFTLFGVIQAQAMVAAFGAIDNVGLRIMLAFGIPIMCSLGLVGACRGTKEICNNALGV